MADFGASFLSSLASTAATAGAAGVAETIRTVASAAGSVSSAVSPFLPSASLVSGILSGSASLLQMAQLNQAGREKAQALNAQASDTRTEVAREGIQATDRANSLKRALLDTIGERDAAYAASGVDLSFGTPQQAREEAVTLAENALTTDQAATTSRVSRLNEKATNLRIMARSARSSASGMADIAGIEAAGKFLRRG